MGLFVKRNRKRPMPKACLIVRRFEKKISPTASADTLKTVITTLIPNR